MLRWQIPQWELVRILNGITCDACKGRKDIDGRSCAGIIGKVIKENYPDEEIPDKREIKKENKDVEITQLQPIKKSPCPKCGEELTHESGCKSCVHCGYTKCS